MRLHHHYVSTLLVLGLGCGSGPAPGPVESGGGDPEQTGLEGTAHRGPTRPVCRVDNPCTAPLSATFEVWQGGRVVARFESDSAGRFRVRLDPGTYKVVPDASTGILIRSQAQEVTVGPNGFTQVKWEFDTGIR
jgi:hypothetical protein